MECPRCHYLNLTLSGLFVMSCSQCGYSSSGTKFLELIYPELQIKLWDKTFELFSLWVELPETGKVAIFKFDLRRGPMTLIVEAEDPGSFMSTLSSIVKLFGTYLARADVRLVGKNADLTCCPVCRKDLAELEQRMGQPEEFVCPCHRFYVRFEYLMASRLTALGYEVQISADVIRIMKPTIDPGTFFRRPSIVLVKVLEMQPKIHEHDLRFFVIRPDQEHPEFRTVVQEIIKMLRPGITLLGVEF